MSLEEGSQLLQRARSGSEDALNEVFARYGERLHGFVRLRLGALLRRRLDSRDIVQATLLKAFERFDHFEGSGSTSMMAWLGWIAKNEIRDQADFHKRRKRNAEFDTTLEGKQQKLAREVQSAVSRLQINEEMSRFEKAFETLSDAHREVVLLRNFEELSFAEIGECLGRSADASRMLYSRAMANLTLAVGGKEEG